MVRQPSFSSDQRPLSEVPYTSANNNGYRGENPYNTAYGSSAKRGGVSKWIKIGIPLLIIIIAGAVVGGVVGSRKHSEAAAAAASSSISSIKNSVGRFPTSTDAYFLPVYPSTSNEAVFTTPTFVATNDETIAFPKDPFQPSNPAPTSVRPDRPRLIAPSYKWEALPTLIQHDPYLKFWNDSIFINASAYFELPPVAYVIDGGLAASGVLDPSRQVKERIKAFAYAYRMTNSTQWLDRAWLELQNAAGNGTQSFGTAPDNWNTQHFLDLAEFTAAFAIGYDWLHDVWSDDQRTAIMYSILNLGLNYGLLAYNDASVGYGWWRTVNGNWNCVCNAGLTMGALAILEDDPTGVAAQILGLTVPNAAQNCEMGPSTDGTWAETANYWYFGTTGWAEMASSLLTATGGTYGLLDTNPSANLTALYHMHVFGMTSLFDYGDHGPNKYSTTANSLLFFGEQFDVPAYTLYQRDRFDAAEPWSMFWYDPTASGAWWDGLALDHFFDNGLDQWTAMRTSWTNNDGMYVAMKAGNHTGHQTHGDLDAGDFVLDAMGQRWAGELGSGDYLSTGYFSSEAADSQRWLYYRKRTEGQNTILIGGNNQEVSALPTVQFDSTHDAQGSSTIFDVPSNSKAFFTADLTTTYSGTSVLRGIRMLAGRKQVLLQDDLTNVQSAIQWRMHTNATVSIDSSGTSATLTLNGQTLVVQMINPPSGAQFTTQEAVRLSTDPALPAGQVDQPNPGVTVLTIALPAGTYSLQVLFNPQWPGMDASGFVTPPSVPVSSWSLTSHG